jgi:hypothetical protein
MKEEGVNITIHNFVRDIGEGRGLALVRYSFNSQLSDLT